MCEGHVQGGLGKIWRLLAISFTAVLVHVRRDFSCFPRFQIVSYAPLFITFLYNVFCHAWPLVQII